MAPHNFADSLARPVNVLIPSLPDCQAGWRPVIAPRRPGEPFVQSGPVTNHHDQGLGEYEVEFFGETDDDDGPVLTWIKKDLTPLQRRALGKAMEHVLQRLGVSVCGTRFGRQLGGGLFEFRLQESAEEILFQFGLLGENQVPPEHERILLRVFCHAYGQKIVLLLHGYDKGKDPSERQQASEIEEARRRLASWRQVHRT